jgi:cytochrome bd ubiquinol oxidase subunit II
MSAEELAGGVAVLSIIAYAVFGGADFGGGIWTLFATGPRKEDQRNALERAIGPVWETNHVWLILLVVTLFVVFPTAYAAIFTALYVPLFIALIGIVARGAAFAFRHYGDRESALSHTSLRFFSAASMLTPFMFGLSFGAVTGGYIEVDGPHVLTGPFAGWLSPFALICGVIAVCLAAFVAAAFMVPRTTGRLREDFRRRAIISSIALGAATTIAIPIAAWDAREFFNQLDGLLVLEAMAVTAIFGIGTLYALWRGYSRLIPALAGITAGGVIVAWAFAQNPYLINPDLTLEDAAAASATVRAFLIALPFGAVILVPSLVLLYAIFSRDVFRAGAPPPSH